MKSNKVKLDKLIACQFKAYKTELILCFTQ